MKRDNQFPEFSKPPVVEVACSIQFESIEGLDTTRLGLLWGQYRARYPRAEQQPPLPPVKENLGPPSAQTIRVRLDMPEPRHWFLNREGTQLIQVQRDRFVVNWRKLDTEEIYPRYVTLRESLTREFGVLQQFLDTEGLASPEVNQCELTYVNHIPASLIRPGEDQASQITTLWSGGQTEPFLPVAESTAFQNSYIIQGEVGPVGRLHIQMDSAFRISDKTPIFVIHLVARGIPEGRGLEGALAFFDRAHEWIVRGFTAITTPHMHQRWERTR